MCRTVNDVSQIKCYMVMIYSNFTLNLKNMTKSSEMQIQLSINILHNYFKEDQNKVEVKTLPNQYFGTIAL